MTTVASRTQWASAEQDEFLALICADRELLQAEFDAIVAAQRPTMRPHRPAQPPRKQSGVTGGERPPAGPRRLRSRRHERRRSKPPRLASTGRPSQRSPPEQRLATWLHNPDTRRKAGDGIGTRVWNELNSSRSSRPRKRPGPRPNPVLATPARTIGESTHRSGSA